MKPSHPRTAQVVFGPFRLDLEVGQLHRAGELVALRPKAMTVLVELVSEAGSLVPRERLLEVGWGKAHVDEEAALHGVIREIRAALGDSATEAEYVATVHRRGYRFVAEVEPAAAPENANSETGSSPRAGGVLSLPALRSVSHRVAAAIVLIVLAAAAWAIADVMRPAPAPVLESADGSIVNVPDRVLRARYLIEHGNGEDLEEALEILRQVTAGADAGPLAWSGRAVAALRLGHDDEAIEAAHHALALDPEDAASYRVLGQLAVVAGHMERAEGHLLRALELDPVSGLSHHALAYFLAGQGEYQRAVRMAETATRLAPGRAAFQANLSRYLLYVRDFSRARLEAQEVEKMSDPHEGPRLLCLETLQAAAWIEGDHEASRAALVLYVTGLGATPAEIEPMLAAPAREGAEAALRWRLAYHDTVEDAPSYHIQAALVHAQLGDPEGVAREIDKLLAGPLNSNPAWMQDPRMDAMRELTAVTALQARYQERVRG